MLAGELIGAMAQELDDPGLIHHQDTVLVALSEAQNLVSWRFRLTKDTARLTLRPQIPLYHVQEVNPRSIMPLYASLDGATLWPVTPTQLRLKDPAWLSTIGTPEYFYRFGITRLGVYPVSDVARAIDLTMLVATRSLGYLTQVMEVPDSYLVRVVDVAVGLLLITGERAFRQGMARLETGLDVPMRPRVTERHSREKQE